MMAAKPPVIECTRFGHKKLKRHTLVCTEDSKKFTIVDVLNYGSFGDVYHVKDAYGMDFCMLSEASDLPRPLQQLETTRCFLRKLEEANARHFIRRIASGETEGLRLLFVEMAGPNLLDLRKYLLQKNFSMSTACHIAIETFTGMQALHSRNIVHRNINPRAFCIGDETRRNAVLFVNCGYVGLLTEKKKPTPRPMNFVDKIFCPRKAHRVRAEMTYEDDLEAWLYMVGDVFDDGALLWKSGLAGKALETDTILQYKEDFIQNSAEGDVGRQFFGRTPLELNNVISMVSGAQKRDYATILRLLALDIPKRLNVNPQDEPDWVRRLTDYMLPWPVPPRRTERVEIPVLPEPIEQVEEQVEGGSSGSGSNPEAKAKEQAAKAEPAPAPAPAPAPPAPPPPAPVAAKDSKLPKTPKGKSEAGPNEDDIGESDYVDLAKSSIPPPKK